MTKKFFGTDGIRGMVGNWPITAEFMLKLGYAAGRVFADGDNKAVVIGKDTRLSGYMFESALEAGLIAAGADVYLLGPMPTPAIAYLTQEYRAAAGIVISASHNPHHDNGIKFFSANGEKLADAVECAIEANLEKDFVTVEPAMLGKAKRMVDAKEKYLAFCRASFAQDLDLRGLKIVVDCANGACYELAPRLLTDLGAEAIAIHHQPDGLNINDGCGSTAPKALREKVLQEKADLGIALDGDGDRVVLVDHRGDLLDGDDILHILACAWRANGRLRGPVVGTSMSNYGLEKALTDCGAEFLRAQVGDRYVHRALVERGGILGGEASGHILCLDRASTGDGLLAALQVLEIVRRRRIALADLRAGWTRYPQKTVNVAVQQGQQVIEREGVQRVLRDVRSQLEQRGRVVLRASGTEPVVRVTVEADNEQLVERLAGMLAEAVRSAA